VLVVDDFERWQTLLHIQLDREPNLHVIAVASDGFESVQKAVELRPRKLPKLNGIEAARQIRKLVPQSKILFLSSHADPEVMTAAFSAGVRGYVLKSEAAQSLLAGIEGVLLDKRFISCRLMNF